MQGDLDGGISQNRSEALDSRRMNRLPAPLPTTERTGHPRIPGWDRQVSINNPAYHSKNGEPHIEPH